MSKEVNKKKKQPLELSRREFLKDASLVVGGAALGSIAFLNACSNGTATTVVETAAPQTITNTATATATATSTVTSPPTTVLTTAPPTTVVTTAPAKTVTATTQVVTDMAGNKVTLPINITRIADPGTTPVINGMLFALGQGSKIVNGSTLLTNSRKYNFVLAPNLLNVPQTVTTEQLVALNPDIVICYDLTSYATYQNAGLNCIYLSWTNATDIYTVMTLLGQIFGQQAAANAYIQYFSNTVSRVTNIVSGIPVSQRPTVLYAQNLATALTNPQLISEWWIPTAGGVSVTASIHTGTTESVTFGAEDLLEWNPQIIIDGSYSDQQSVIALSNPIFAQLSAVTGKRVYPLPQDVHTWGNRVVEEPLTILWAVSQFYPALTQSINMNAELKNFFTTIYGYDLTDAQVTEILGSNITSLTAVSPSGSTTFTPSTGAAGAVLTFTGSGWWRSENITGVTVGGVTATNNLVVSSSGHLSGTVTVPSGVAKGAATIVITASGSGANTFTNAFTITG